MPDLPPPQAPEVEIVVVHPPRLAPLGGEAAFSAVRIGPESLANEPRLDEVLKTAPGVSLFRRTGSGAANPTTQGLSLRAIAPSGAGRALVTLDGAPQNDPFGGWVVWSGLPSEGIEEATVVRARARAPTAPAPLPAWWRCRSGRRPTASRPPRSLPENAAAIGPPWRPASPACC